MHLNAHSYFSLRYGTLSIDDLIKEAVRKNVTAMALTDINNSTGIIDFVKACKENNIKPIAGIEFRKGDEILYTGIAKNNNGFMKLNEFLSKHNIEKTELPDFADEIEDVFFVYPFKGNFNKKLKENEFIGIKPDEINKIFSSEFKNNHSKLLIQNSVTFIDDKGFSLHKNLRAIGKNTLISKLTPNQIASPNEKIFSIAELLNYYKNYPQIIKNTEKLSGECSIDFDYESPKNKKTFTGSFYDDKILLEKLAMEGMEYHFGKKNKIARERVKHELEIIFKLNFSAYFLITWDIIRYSMARGIYHVGRGSGANSVVAYCLKITDVDPIELDLYFERFINPKRTSPPDFDIDYSWKDRDDVQDYIFKRYGCKHTALLGTMSTFKGKSIYRELGKIYGLPKAEIDDLVKHPEREINNSEITRTIHSFALMMIDFPNQRSIHAGGILISEKPINYYTALDMPPKGYPTTQWDMYVAEDIGFEKLDILSQRGIGHIKESVEIIKANRNIDVDIHRVEEFKKDTLVKHQLKTAETNGCFYIESPAMRGLLRKLRCDNYLSLVAASSIIRPGVAKSGMMREYILRFHNPEKINYIHPVMEQQLKETYGVMVYQEDVLKICHYFAGLDLSDADVLRRAMSGKHRNKKEFARIVEKFFSNCKERAYPDEIAKEVWRQIESFAAYSFSKAHSASYAVESFQSLYLKAHFPLEFMVAVINNFGGFYHGWVYFNEAKRQGATINLPCVNIGSYNTTIKGDQIYIGFVHIANLETKTAKYICEERKINGLYQDIEDFVTRTNIGVEQMIILIRTGAFRFTGKTKAALLWETHLFMNKAKKNISLSLFKTPARKFKLPELEYNKIEDAYDEIELIGFPVSMSQFDLLKTSFRGEILTKDMLKNTGKKVRMLGHLVTIKYVRTVKKEMMNFGTFLDFSGEFFDTVHFSNSLKRYPFRGYGIYLLKGKIIKEFGYPSLEVEKMAKLPIMGDPRG
ncbi:MAG: DNA polymerase III subunit alpha [Bacteroidales bacterium]|nr:DNA polymerase III subunit alpha [Bacteroidales bacterium]